ncbi:hypothetical protein [Candidatus Cyanaurora vandensis]|uniref:hypothetical protein n=1 Tax=Candidatus Cyanaurora vandensis TaxID=2714958 RepID=UPI00257C2B02|nr:hypothetical protein [Candidatus Cyanaurora vandensis]
MDTVQAVMAATGFNRKRAMLLTRQGVYVDHSRWIESFFCPTHGTMWLIVNKDKDTGEHEVRVPNDQEWEKTCGLIDPNQPNPSVSQYSWQSSRGPVVSGSR